MVRNVLSLGGLWALLACIPTQASVIMSHCTEGATLYATVKGGFVGAGSTPADFRTLRSSVQATPRGGRSPWTRAMQTKMPHASTSIHDHVTVLSRTNYTFDSPSDAAGDRITLVAKASAAAHDAHNLAGNPASARIWAVASLRFDVDVPEAAGGGPVGYFAMGRLRPLDKYGTLSEATVFEDGLVVGRLSAGGKGIRVPLMFDGEYELRLKYQGRVTYNDCPWLCVDQKREALAHPLGVSVTATIADVPEPGAIGGILCAGVLLGRRKRGRRE